MASITMSASFLNGSADTAVSKRAYTAPRRSVVMATAARVPESGNDSREDASTKRRELVFAAAAAAAAAACSIAKVAMADEPKRGTEEAKKKYNPVCVSMPTSRICHK